MGEKIAIIFRRKEDMGKKRKVILGERSRAQINLLVILSFRILLLLI
jgi:hypothetical protein